MLRIQTFVFFLIVIQAGSKVFKSFSVARFAFLLFRPVEDMRIAEPAEAAATSALPIKGQDGRTGNAPQCKQPSVLVDHAPGNSDKQAAV